MKYKAVIFDLYGTLVPTFSEKKYRSLIMQIASILSVSPEPLWERWSATFDESFLGIISDSKAKIIHVCRELGVDPEHDKIIKASQALFEYEALAMVPRSGAVELLTALKQKEHKIGLITDCVSETVTLWENTSIKPFFEATIFSCAVGIKKPDPRIYNLVLEKLKVKPQECLYIGDGGSNELTGASNVGMHPVLIRVPTEETYLFGAEEWKGTAISSLNEILDLVK
jgi:putative hydrolase of the HAD superfamily